MTFRKNWFGYVIWAFYALAACAGFVTVLVAALSGTLFDNFYGRMSIVCLSFVLIFGYYILVRKLYLRSAPDKHGHGVAWEIVTIAVTLFLAVFLRVCFFDMGSEDALYYETAMVSGTALPVLTHGAQYLYLIVLRGIFLVFGNHFGAGLILQIALQAVAAFIWYLAVRRLCGPVAACVFFAGFLLFPDGVRMGLTYSPGMLYLLLSAVVLLMEGRFLQVQRRGGEVRWYAWLQGVCVGIAAGLLTYLDVTGLLLLFPVLFVFFVRREENGEDAIGPGVTVLRFFSVVAACAATAALLFLVDAVQSGVSFGKAFSVWCGFFAPEFPALREYVSAHLTNREGYELWLYLAMAVLVLMGVPAFLVDRKEEKQLLWVVLLGVLSGVCILGMPQSDMDGGHMLFALILTLAGAGVQVAVSVRQPEPERSSRARGDTWEPIAAGKPERGPEAERRPRPEGPVKAKEVPRPEGPVKAQEMPRPEGPARAQEMPKPEQGTGAGKRQETEKKTEVEKHMEPAKKVNYIENPLPLPKKHERKAMDFPYEVPEEMMKYDINVPDTDNYDL